MSRFAKNTVDGLSTVRKLKEKGVVIFSRRTSIPLVVRESFSLQL
jgi:hypothetical protein